MRESRHGQTAACMPLLVCLFLLITLAGDAAHGASPSVRCGSAPAARGAGAGPRLRRVVVVVLENKACADVIGSSEAPYLNRLARRYAFASRSYALTHPSLPNYLGLTGGSTFGIRSDCTDCAVRARNLVDQLERAHVSWKAYMEGMPRSCFRGGESGRYVKRHDPFLYYVDVASSLSRCRRVVPLTQLDADIARHSLPHFVWITPDLCHDMHDCPVGDGDRFLARLVPRLLRAVGAHGAIFVTWDEGVGGAGCCGRAAGGNVATIVAGPAARPGGRSGLAYDHYSLLRTIEDAFGLPHLRGAACPCAPALSALLR
jgi:phosphatidylinositol-3-phosphatase